MTAALPVLVRCRDGALYRDPAWVLAEGFVRFGVDEGHAEFVVWLPADAGERTPPPDGIFEALERAFGYGAKVEPLGHEHPLCSANVNTVHYLGRAQRVIPGTEPWEYRPAISYRFKVVSRPPRPTMHRGVERYASRVRGALLFDWPAAHADSLALDVPEK